jgi:hypothetical protein
MSTKGSRRSSAKGEEGEKKAKRRRKEGEKKTKRRRKEGEKKAKTRLKGIANGKACANMQRDAEPLRRLASCSPTLQLSHTPRCGRQNVLIR